MLLYKITLFLWVIMLVYRFFLMQYIRTNKKEQLRFKVFENYAPPYAMAFGLLIIVCVLMALISLFYFLFF